MTYSIYAKCHGLQTSSIPAFFCILLYHHSYLCCLDTHRSFHTIPPSCLITFTINIFIVNWASLTECKPGWCHTICSTSPPPLVLYSLFTLHISYKEYACKVTFTNFTPTALMPQCWKQWLWLWVWSFLTSQGVNQCDRFHCQTIPPTQGPISN